MKAAEELLTEISAASRRTRDAALLALLDAIKSYLEANPRPSDTSAPLNEPQAGRLLYQPRPPKLPAREIQLRKAAYMRQWMARKRQRDRDAKNAIINSTSPDRNRAGADAADNENLGADQAPTPKGENQ